MKKIGEDYFRYKKKKEEARLRKTQAAAPQKYA
jgi:hypothetical protein